MTALIVQKGIGTFPWIAMILDLHGIVSEVRSVLVAVAALVATRPTNQIVRHVISRYLVPLLGEWSADMEIAGPRRTGHRLLTADRRVIVSGQII